MSVFYPIFFYILFSPSHVRKSYNLSILGTSYKDLFLVGLRWPQLVKRYFSLSGYSNPAQLVERYFSLYGISVL